VRASRSGLRSAVSEQLGIDSLLGSLVRNYMVPAETNTVWYVLGGVLGIALALEILTGIALTFSYPPDAAHAWQQTQFFLDSPGWSIVLNFHYFTSYLIFGLVLLHMMRVFLSRAYGGIKKGLWQVGVALAAVVFALSITGETLHWDERGFAVPWHVGEFFEAIGLEDTFNWVHTDLLDVSFATPKLIIFYALHVALLPALLVGLIALHYYLIKVKGISLPFWHRTSVKVDETSFGKHLRLWFVWAGIILGAILIVSIIDDRGPGPAPQNLPVSPFFGAEEGPGGLGITPTFPISWTHGLNRFVTIAFGLEPDIWGTVIGMVIMLGTLVLIPYVDRSPSEPRSWAEAFDLRTRGWAFALIVLFWATFILGVVVNEVSPVG
jgi:quinol-cytochrome oxidoreductase complex cytochrome b subunit